MVKINFSLKLSKLISVSVFVSVLFYREAELLLAYLAAVLHEWAHGFASVSLGVMPRGAECTVFGVRLWVPFVSSSKHKLIIYSAGPLASFVFFGYLRIIGRVFCVTSRLYHFFAYANFFIGAVNLLPVFPLDGAMLFRTVLSKYLGVIRGTRVYRLVSVFFYGFVGGLNFLFISAGVINLSMIMILIFLILGINKERSYSIVEKKAVLSGEIVSRKKIKYIACDAESELLCLAGYISADYTLLVASFYNERFFGELGQAEIIDGIKKYGALCQIKDCIEKSDVD